MTLGISESTVNWHLANAFERLGASSRAEAVALSIRSNGAAVARSQPAPVQVVAATTPSLAWPRLVAIAIAIAVAGALLGGATVATFHIGQTIPTDAPPSESLGTPTATPVGSALRENLIDETAPVDIVTGASPEATTAPARTAPSTPLPLPALSAPPAPTIPVALPTGLLSTPPPLPSASLPPLPIPIPTLPIP